jgi:PDZ domain-containing protein
MSRKTATLSFATVALLVLLAIAFLIPMPYVVMSPGITENTLGSFKGKPVINISGHKTYPTTGSLDLTTVSVTSSDFHPRLGNVLEAWWRRNEIILPREAVYPPDESPDEVNKQNQADMSNSQSAAVVVGLREAGISDFRVEVTDIVDGSPAQGVLRLGDIITQVDGTPVSSADDAATAITGVEPGSTVVLRIERAGKPRTVRIVTEKSPDDPSQARVGISIADDPPFQVDIDLGQEIGGPSAGLMFSLGIYDKLTPGQLTGGMHIAGTGTIDESGRVGVIGGIQQKIAGAVDSGATVFLVPHGNCAEAVGAPDASSVQLVDVTTMDGAVHALESITSGDGAGVPQCAGG